MQSLPHEFQLFTTKPLFSVTFQCDPSGCAIVCMSCAYHACLIAERTLIGTDSPASSAVTFSAMCGLQGECTVSLISSCLATACGSTLYNCVAILRELSDKATVRYLRPGYMSRMMYSMCTNLSPSGGRATQKAGLLFLAAFLLRAICHAKHHWLVIHQRLCYPLPTSMHACLTMHRPGFINLHAHMIAATARLSSDTLDIPILLLTAKLGAVTHVHRQQQTCVPRRQGLPW